MQNVPHTATTLAMEVHPLSCMCYKSITILPYRIGGKSIMALTLIHIPALCLFMWAQMVGSHGSYFQVLKVEINKSVNNIDE